MPASVPLQSFVLQMEIAFLEEDRAALIQLWHTEVPQNCQSSNSTLKARPLVRNNDKNISLFYSQHSSVSEVLCYWFKIFWRTVPINMFYKASKIHFLYRKHIFSKNTYLIACIAYLKDSKSHSLRWHCNCHFLCRGNLKDRWVNRYFQSTFSQQTLQKYSSLFTVPP